MQGVIIFRVVFYNVHVVAFVMIKRENNFVLKVRDTIDMYHYN